MKARMALLTMLVVTLLATGCAPISIPTVTVQPEPPTVVPTATAEPEPTASPTTTPTATAETPSEPAVAGHWEGTLTILGSELQIAVDLQTEDGTLAGTIDIPEQGATGLALHDVSFEDGTLHFEMLEGPRLATFEGQLQDDGTIAGSFEQAGFEGTFQMQPAEVQVEEEEPVPYLREDVTFENDDVTLAGTLTLPDADGPHPAVILISGSGPQNRNEELPGVPGYRPFRVIADHLTRQGIAVLRYDDRGAAKSTGEHLAATSEDFAADAEAGFEYLRSRPEIDPAQVGLFGHSEGGMIAAMIAARNPHVAFVISMAGPAVSGYDVLLVQNRRILEASGASEEEIAAAMEEVRQSLDLNVAEDWDALKELALETGLKQLEALPEAQREALGDAEAYLQSQIAEMMPFYQVWMHFFLTYDPGEGWAQVDAPVLALFGGLDTQVDVEQNKPALEEALAEAGNADVTVKVFPEANHLFLKAETGSPSEYVGLPKEFVPGFLETISDWLLARVETAAEAQDVGLPNPAAVHCEEQGYIYEIRSDDAGNQYGVCIFPDGSECDAWAYFRGECAPESAHPDAEESEAVGGWVGIIVKLPPGNQFGQYFEREDGERYDVGAIDGAVWDVIREVQSTGAQVKVWGTLFTGVPASEARHVEVERIEIVSEPAGG